MLSTGIFHCITQPANHDIFPEQTREKPKNKLDTVSKCGDILTRPSGMLRQVFTQMHAEREVYQASYTVRASEKWQSLHYIIISIICIPSHQ